MSAPDGRLRAGEVVVVRVTHSAGVHVHTCPSWRDAGRYVEGWASVTRLVEVSMRIETDPSRLVRVTNEIVSATALV